MMAGAVHRLTITEAKSSLDRLAKRAHLNNEYFILERDGVAVAAILDAEELEDYLELRDPAVRRQIATSNRDIRAGRTRPASRLLAELKTERRAKPGRVRPRK
jgi:hypothetical protein